MSMRYNNLKKLISNFDYSKKRDKLKKINTHPPESKKHATFEDEKTKKEAAKAEAAAAVDAQQNVMKDLQDRLQRVEELVKFEKSAEVWGDRIHRLQDRVDAECARIKREQAENYMNYLTESKIDGFMDFYELFKQQIPMLMYTVRGGCIRLVWVLE
jgi:hypothetical protein